MSTRSGRVGDGSHMPLLSHIAELRRHLIISGIALAVGFAAAISLYDYIIDFLFKPLLELTASEEGEVLYITTIAEGLLVRLKISLLAGFIITLPMHLYNVLHFVFPGLLRREKQIIGITLACSLALVTGSFIYSYYTIIPVSIAFLTGKGFIPENTGLLLGFSGNIFYILQFMLMAVIVFQLPIVLEVLLILNLVKRKTLVNTGRYLIVLFFIIAAVISPPDFVTQLGLALPMTALYYLTILIARVFRFGKE